MDSPLDIDLSIYWPLLPVLTLTINGENFHSFKDAKQRVTMLAQNMDRGARKQLLTCLGTGVGEMREAMDDKLDEIIGSLDDLGDAVTGNYDASKQTSTFKAKKKTADLITKPRNANRRQAQSVPKRIQNYWPVVEAEAFIRLSPRGGNNWILAVNSLARKASFPEAINRINHVLYRNLGMREDVWARQLKISNSVLKAAINLERNFSRHFTQEELDRFDLEFGELGILRYKSDQTKHARPREPPVRDDLETTTPQSARFSCWAFRQRSFNLIPPANWT